MNIVSRYLAGEDIVLGLDVPGKTRALEEVALLLERRHPVKHETVFRAPVDAKRSDRPRLDTASRFRTLAWPGSPNQSCC